MKNEKETKQVLMIQIQKAIITIKIIPIIYGVMIV